MTDAAPDILGTVRGYRTWHIKKGQLLSPYYTHTWGEGENHATCSLTFHTSPEIPGDVCACGFYSMYRPRKPLISQIDGVVENSGPIWLQDWGMRARSSTIVALHVPERRQRKTLAKRYPSITVYKSQKAMLKDFPPAEEICGVRTVDAPDVLLLPRISRWIGIVPLLAFCLAFGVLVDADLAQPDWVTSGTLIGLVVVGLRTLHKTVGLWK